MIAIFSSLKPTCAVFLCKRWMHFSEREEVACSLTVPLWFNFRAMFKAVESKMFAVCLHLGQNALKITIVYTFLGGVLCRRSVLIANFPSSVLLKGCVLSRGTSISISKGEVGHSLGFWMSAKKVLAWVGVTVLTEYKRRGDSWFTAGVVVSPVLACMVNM